MEAKLPDINAGIVTHRKSVMNGYDIGDYYKTLISFDSIIALLPEEYKPSINTKQYYDTIKGANSIICDKCKEKFTRETIIPYELLLSNLDRFLMNQTICIVWTCPKCDNTRPLIGSNTQHEEFQQPFYTGIIPDMPKRHGLHDRIGYSKRFKEWYQIAFREIEYKIGLYRAEYQRQNPDDEILDIEDA